MSARPLDDAERDLLWTLGKAAALASVARIVATQAEKAHQLEQRIDLAREIHEGVIQRLFGVSMALDGEGDLPAEARAAGARARPRRRSAICAPRCSGRSAARRGATQTTLLAEVERLARVHPDLGVTLEAGGEGDVPPALEPLAQSVLAEAVRNAHKHAQPDPRQRPRRTRRRRVRARGRQRRRPGAPAPRRDGAAARRAGGAAERRRGRVRRARARHLAGPARRARRWLSSPRSPERAAACWSSTTTTSSTGASG